MLRLLRACGVPWPLPSLPWRHPVFAGSWNDPPRRIFCAKTARLGGGYPHWLPTRIVCPQYSLLLRAVPPVKSQCKECGGSAICSHGKNKYKCKECGGKKCGGTVTIGDQPHLEGGASRKARRHASGSGKPVAVQMWQGCTQSRCSCHVHLAYCTTRCCTRVASAVLRVRGPTAALP